MALLGAGCAGGGTVPVDEVNVASNSAEFPSEMIVIEATWDGFAASAIDQDYDAFQSYVDTTLTDAEIAGGMGRFFASVPEIDWTKSNFESEVRVSLVSTKGADLGTWSLNTDGTWTLEQRYWKLSTE